MSRQMKAQSNWRGELSEYAGVLSTYDGYGDLAQQHAKTDTKAKKEIKEDPKIKNKIVINPTVKEAFGEIGAFVLELSEEAVVQELTKEDIEELQRKKDAQEGREPARQNVEEDDKWIQKATKNMRKDKPCTGDKFGSDSCPPGSKRYNLAKTFKKMAKEEAETPKNVKKIAGELDKAVEMHKSQAKRLRKAGISESDNRVMQLNVKRAKVNSQLARAEAKKAKQQKSDKYQTKTPASNPMNNQIATEETINEVSPPGFGHTKSGKGDKKGGTAAAFDRARKEGRFKGLPGSTTEKEKKADMFKLMWAMKDKEKKGEKGGGKPHYKPGTDKKYKKYQKNESASNPFQVHFDKDGKSYTDKGTPAQAKKIAKNIAANKKKGPMAQDPYKSRAGESD